MDVKKTFFALVELTRPIEWGKSFTIMVIGALTTEMMFGVPLDFFLFLKAFLCILLLWSGLYTLNDFTDWKQDALHSVKKFRAIPSGRVKPETALLFSLILLALSVFLVLSFNQLIIVSWLAMLVNQLLYTMRPFELKKRPVLDLISGSLINPVFRFYFGWLLFIPAFNAPVTAILPILGIQFGGYGLYRMISQEHEKRLQTSASVVVFGEKTLLKVFYLAIISGIVSYFVAALTIWKQSFLWFGLLMLLPMPIYFGVLTSPQKANLKKMYNILYIHNLFFVFGFVLVYLFF